MVLGKRGDSIGKRGEGDIKSKRLEQENHQLLVGHVQSGRLCPA
jgi:hypothetical protein